MTAIDPPESFPDDGAGQPPLADPDAGHVRAASVEDLKTLDPDWFLEAETIRVVDAFVVDVMFNACGESYESLQPYAVTFDFDGVPVHTITIEGLLKTKQTSRDKDKLDRMILERGIQNQGGTD